MSTIIEILGSDQVKDSRQDINDNFEALNNDKLEVSDAVTEFIQLSDVPQSYEGEGGKVIAVNDEETGLETLELTIPTAFTGLDDTPDSYEGQANKIVGVNSEEDALEFKTVQTTTQLEFETEDDTPIEEIIYTFETGMIQTIMLEARIMANWNTGPEGAGYIRRAVYNQNGSIITLVGSVVDEFTAETIPGWDVDFVIDGFDIKLELTGDADEPVTWNVELITNVSYSFAD